MFVNYTLDVRAAKASLPASLQISPFTDARLGELTEKLQEIADDVRLTAEDLIRIATIHAQLCVSLSQQALAYYHEDGDLLEFGE